MALDKRFHNGEVFDWALFTREQSIEDQHNAISRLKQVYDGQPFLGQGLSNGGNDVVLLEHAYPDDLQGVITIGTPFMTSNDERFLAFFDTVDQDVSDASRRDPVRGAWRSPCGDRAARRNSRQGGGQRTMKVT